MPSHIRNRHLVVRLREECSCLRGRTIGTTSTIWSRQVIACNCIALSCDRQDTTGIVVRGSQAIENSGNLTNGECAFVGEVVVGFRLLKAAETGGVGVKSSSSAAFDGLGEVEGVEDFAKALGVCTDGWGRYTFQQRDCTECEATGVTC